jgi:hypothetical protein
VTHKCVALVLRLVTSLIDRKGCFMSRKLLRAAYISATASLVVGSLTGNWSTPVLAAQNIPVREPAPFPDATGQFCTDFQVLVHAVENRDVMTTFSDGRINIAGRLILEVTNLESGKSIVLNAFGPGMINPEDATISLEGPFLLFGEAGFFGPGSPAELSLNAGQAVVSLNDFSILSRVGHSEELCAVLADP